MHSNGFYQNHLNKVSRSFAFCISRLDAPLRRYISSSYLICRILDTLEDAAWDTKSKQLENFEIFENFLLEIPNKAQLSGWVRSFPKEIKKGERLLLQDSFKVFSDLHKFPEPVKDAIQSTVLCMSRGMKKFNEGKKSGELKFNSLKEVNQYCFYVAGVVGELLTQIVGYTDIKNQWKDKSYLNAYHFGLFLQKVNILKDQLKDEKEGRFFVIERSEFLNSISLNARGAMDYLNSIPVYLKSFRLFCAWSLFLGLATIPLTEQGFVENKSAKLPKVKTLALIYKIETLISDSEKMESLFASYYKKSGLTQLDQITEGANVSGGPAGISFYNGNLTFGEMSTLGLT